MPEPSEKNPQIEEFLEKNFGRTTAIKEGRCVGCDEVVRNEDFDTDQGRKEYTISGLGPKCQREVFGSA